jgi:prepilin-type N-terminal cleavage/methylation domain-containing protein
MKRRGFTLLEMLMTTVIIVIIATMGIAGYQGMLHRAESRECAVNLGVLNSMVTQYSLENDTLPATLSLFTPEQIEKAYAEVNARQGLDWQLAKAILKFDRSSKAFAQTLVSGEFLRGNSEQFNCPADPSQNFDSYALNSRFADVPWRFISPSAVLVADGEENGGDGLFTSLDDQEAWHRSGVTAGTQFSQGITKSGMIVDSSLTASAGGKLAPVEVANSCEAEYSSFCVPQCHGQSSCIGDCEDIRLNCRNSVN